MNRAAARLAALALLLSLTACGARAAPQAGVFADASQSAGDAVATAAAESQTQDPPENPRDGAQASVPEGGGARPAGAPTSGGGEWANAKGAPQDRPVVRLVLSAHCVEPGQVLQVLVQGPPRASVAMSATFEGSDEPGGSMIGLTDDRGEFRWTVAVPPHVRPGAGWIGVAATGPDRGSGGGVARERFDVAALGGC